jgi:hypothetical protein
LPSADRNVKSEAMKAMGFAVELVWPGWTGTRLTEVLERFDCAYSLTRLPVKTPRHWVLMKIRDSLPRNAVGSAFSATATALENARNIA